MDNSNPYINKTIDGNLSKCKSQISKILIIKKSYNNNIKKTKNDFKKINKKTLQNKTKIYNN